MQAELLRDIEPPSYEESVYFKQLIGQIKAQRRKTPPPSYENNGVFNVFRQTQLLDNKSITPSAIGQATIESPTEILSDDKNQQDAPMDERLERVSSCLQQMIDAANQSLTSSLTAIQPPPPPNDDDTASLDKILKEQRKKNRQWRIKRKKSLERLSSSQASLARTIDQLNISITQHIINNEATSSPTYDYTQYDNNTTDRHYHHHHHHHHYTMHHTNSSHHQRQTSKKSMVTLWTNLLTQAALVFGICHQLLSWSTPTSSILSVAWLVTMLLAKKKINRRKSGCLISRSSSSYTSSAEHSITSITLESFYSHLKSSLVPRYSSLLSLFRKQ